MLILTVNNRLNVFLSVVSLKVESLVLYFLIFLLMTCLMFPMFCSMCCKLMTRVYYISGSDINALFDVLNIGLSARLEWLNANKLTLNVDKTFYILFHRRPIKTDNLKLTIGRGTCNQTSQ